MEDAEVTLSGKGGWSPGGSLEEREINSNMSSKVVCVYLPHKTSLVAGSLKDVSVSSCHRQKELLGLLVSAKIRSVGIKGYQAPREL